jgi:hypothetical protein
LGLNEYVPVEEKESFEEGQNDHMPNEFNGDDKEGIQENQYEERSDFLTGHVWV